MEADYLATTRKILRKVDDFRLSNAEFIIKKEAQISARVAIYTQIQRDMSNGVATKMKKV